MIASDARGREKAKAHHLVDDGWGTGGAWGRRGERLGVSEQHKGERKSLGGLGGQAQSSALSDLLDGARRSGGLLASLC